MKHCKKLTLLLIAALLLAALMTGCTGLGADEIGEAASTWLAAKNDGLTEYLQKLEMVDDAYQKLLTDEARDMLDSAGCAGVEITWGSQPIEPIEAIMQAAGLR